jgi:alanine dehydrogenase
VRPEQGGERVTLLLTEQEVEGLLDMDSTLHAIELVLREQAEGRATNLARRRVALPTAGLNVMFAGAPQMDALGLKAYTVARTGARFYTMLFDPQGGELLSIMQSDRLGQMRTGAASGVATRHLAREDASTLGIYGAGWQAESQLEAIAAVRDLERVIVHSRSEENRKAFAERMGERLGMEIETTPAPDEPAAQDIVVTVTSSREPVLFGEWLRPGAHVNAAGSNFLFKSEIDGEVVRRASFVCADSREELGLEAGDLVQSLEIGIILPEAVYELGQVIAGQVEGRRGPEDITLFASQGLALEDMAAARVVYDRAVERDVGRVIEF